MNQQNQSPPDFVDALFMTNCEIEPKLGTKISDLKVRIKLNLAVAANSTNPLHMQGIHPMKFKNSRCTKVRPEVLKIRQESWLFYRQIFQDFAAIATKFSRFINLNS